MAGASGAVARGQVAVVTGAASGIGLGLCERFAAEGMRVVMADVEEPALRESAARLADQGHEVLPVVTDVSDAAQVGDLRAQAEDAFGGVHVLCNNAGVGGPHIPLWETSRADWEWVLGVNLWGVINGVRAFMPLLLAQDAAHIVNTASIFGVFAGALGPYGVSKHAVVALSESLHFQLVEAGARVGVSVLCPGAVRTRFGDSGRNRPAHADPAHAGPAHAGPADPPSADPAQSATRDRLRQLQGTGREPSEVADLVVEAIRASRFYILTSENRNEAVRRRAREILDGGAPAPPFP